MQELGRVLKMARQMKEESQSSMAGSSAPSSPKASASAIPQVVNAYLNDYKVIMKGLIVEDQLDCESGG